MSIRIFAGHVSFHKKKTHFVRFLIRIRCLGWNQNPAVLPMTEDWKNLETVFFFFRVKEASILSCCSTLIAWQKTLYSPGWSKCSQRAGIQWVNSLSASHFQTLAHEKTWVKSNELKPPKDMLFIIIIDFFHVCSLMIGSFRSLFAQVCPASEIRLMNRSAFLSKWTICSPHFMPAVCLFFCDQMHPHCVYRMCFNLFLKLQKKFFYFFYFFLSDLSRSQILIWKNRLCDQRAFIIIWLVFVLVLQNKALVKPVHAAKNTKKKGWGPLN